MYNPSFSFARLAVMAEALANTRVSGSVFNQYACNVPDNVRPANTQRLQNLLLYWQKMAIYRPDVLLVGEAPGYRGCRLTGIPFTSPAILRQPRGNHPFFGEEHGFKLPEESLAQWREASATIVWQTITDLERPPLLWNAFPFHPFRPGDTQSNRRPSNQELNLGLPFLRQLIDLFDIRSIVAVGNIAAEALMRAGVPARKVRHPSHGGKNAFRNGLLAVYDECTEGGWLEKS